MHQFDYILILPNMIGDPIILLSDGQLSNAWIPIDDEFELIVICVIEVKSSKNESQILQKKNEVIVKSFNLTHPLKAW